MGGLTHLGISEGKGGIKHGSRPWLGMDIFWNCPIAVLWKLFDIYRFSYKHCNFSRVCLLVKMASKTVTRSINKSTNSFLGQFNEKI